MNNWISRTGQSCKLWAASLMAILTCVLLSLLTRTEYLYTPIFAVSFGAISFLLFITLRCPFCKKSICWFFMKNKNMSSWFHSLISTDHCPMCKKEIQYINNNGSITHFQQHTNLLRTIIEFLGRTSKFIDSPRCYISEGHPVPGQYLQLQTDYAYT